MTCDTSPAADATSPTESRTSAMEGQEGLGSVRSVDRRSSSAPTPCPPQEQTTYPPDRSPIHPSRTPDPDAQTVPSPRVDATQVNQYIPQFELGEVVKVGNYLLTVDLLSRGTMTLHRHEGVSKAFSEGFLFKAKGYYWRVRHRYPCSIMVTPHGLTKAGIFVRNGRAIDPGIRTGKFKPLRDAAKPVSE